MKHYFSLFVLLLCGFSLQAEEFTSLSVDFPKVAAYTDATGYGYDLGTTWDGRSTAPFFFSVNVPDGNYRVTITIGSKKRAAITTIRCESRRLFVENLATKKGELVTRTFVVNKRDSLFTDAKGKADKVKLKPGEGGKLHWDRKLTFEINGDAPAIQSIEIERDDQIKPHTTKYNEQELSQMLTDDNKPIFVFDDGGVLGYAFCQITEVQNNKLLQDAKTLYIDDICVDESARGRYVGKSLFEHVRNYAQSIGCHNITLNVWAGNDAALSFYQNMGMQVQKTTMEIVLC